MPFLILHILRQPGVRSSDGVTPATVVELERESITGQIVSETIQRMIDIDDVMTNEFASQIFFKIAPGASPIVKDTHHNSLGDPHFQSDLPRQGPYFLIGTNVYEAFRLYKDEYNAFACGLVQTENNPPR